MPPGQLPSTVPKTPTRSRSHPGKKGDQASATPAKKFLKLSPHELVVVRVADLFAPRLRCRSLISTTQLIDAGFMVADKTVVPLDCDREKADHVEAKPDDRKPLLTHTVPLSCALRLPTFSVALVPVTITVDLFIAILNLAFLSSRAQSSTTEKSLARCFSRAAAISAFMLRPVSAAKRAMRCRMSPGSRISIWSEPRPTWLNGGVSAPSSPVAAAGTVDWLFAEYRSDHRFKKLDAKSKRNHEDGFKIVGGHVLKDGRRLGQARVSAIDTSIVDPLYLALLPIKDAAGNVIGERRTTVNHAMKSCRSAETAGIENKKRRRFTMSNSLRFRIENGNARSA